jgi:hypothetical protein
MNKVRTYEPYDSHLHDPPPALQAVSESSSNASVRS